MLTGVWADKHGVKDNGFSGGRSKYRTFFSRLGPGAKTVALVSWKALDERVFSQGEGARLVLDGSVNGFERADRLVAESAVKVLADEDPTALFVFFGQVDANGHQHGFHPKVPQYSRAIAQVDRHIGAVMEALGKRTSYAKEDWLTIVATDHGGRGLNHRGGRPHEEVRFTFLILHGPSVRKGSIQERTANVDVAYTALTHLGVRIDDVWQFDGRSVGLKGK
jgi:arylsulfatase A-like enzyme